MSHVVRAPSASVAFAPPRPRVHRPVGPAVSRVGLVSVARVAVVLSAAVATLLLATGMLAWWLLARGGAVDHAEGLVADLFGFESFELHAAAILRIAVLVAVAVVALATVAAVALAALYNAMARLTGGVEIETVDRRREAKG